jgi:hypothetical protein
MKCDSQFAALGHRFCCTSGKQSAQLRTLALTMTYHHRVGPSGRLFCDSVKLRVSARFASLVVGGGVMILSQGSFAQITQGSGSGQQDNRTSAMGSTPDPAASQVHESLKPQTKDGSSGKARGKTAGQAHQTPGAGGFDNGLYGTGAGSNK